ncbi:MAG: exodeoxyribonuclease VII large subunit [bacterium]|nr:exodeoxyribonuclease VII large subunit [bacterium]
MEVPGGEADQTLRVSELIAKLREQFDDFGTVWVEGEVGSVFRSRAGHFYFDLKDEQTQLRAVWFHGSAARSPIEPEEGMLVRVRARLDLYPERGALQLIVDRLAPRGEGALRASFERLKKRLSEEGLFDAEHKRPLPYLPRRIGLITSLEGAAIHDFLRGLRARFPASDVLVYGAPVQGEGAWRKLVRGLHLLDARQDIDAIVLTRGGGSIEDLWNFNREELVRAIFELETPVVSAIGHEVDVMLSDLVADVRAATPTAAAELIVPDAGALFEALEARSRRLSLALQRRIDGLASRLDGLRRGVVHPRSRIEEMTRRVQQIQLRLIAAVKRGHERSFSKLGALGGQLDALSPLGVLGRGYSITRRESDDAIVFSSAQVSQGETIRVRLKDDALLASVLETEIS